MTSSTSILRGLARAAFILSIASVCWGANALIVHDGTAGIEADALGNLTAKLTTAGFTVTANVGVPGGSLATYQQIWDIRFNNTTPLSVSDDAAYNTYLQGGGSLFLMGENAGFATRNASITAFIAAEGGGTIFLTTPDNTETVLPPFTGPNALSTIHFLAVGGTTAPGTGAFITEDAKSRGAALVFAPNTLSNAPAGTLIVVFDVNFLQAGADADSQTFTKNLIAYLAAPAAVPNVTVLQIGYAANLGAGQSVVNVTNAGTTGGRDNTDYICANVYVFAEDQQLISCCACPLSPNDLQTLSVQNDLINNTLTPGVPIGVTVALVATDDTGKGACNAATVTVAQLVPGLRAWGTTLHAAPGGGFAVTENKYLKTALSIGVGSELDKMTSLCGFIQADGSKYGICNSCKPGAQGANKQ